MGVPRLALLVGLLRGGEERCGAADRRGGGLSLSTVDDPYVVILNAQSNNMSYLPRNRPIPIPFPLAAAFGPSHDRHRRPKDRRRTCLPKTAEEGQVFRKTSDKRLPESSKNEIVYTQDAPLNSGGESSASSTGSPSSVWHKRTVLTRGFA